VKARGPEDILEERLQAFLRLNPYALGVDVRELYALAERVHPRHFPRFVRFAEHLIATFIDSPWKQAERRVLEEYFQYIEQASRLLADRGEISSDMTETPREAMTVALVPRHYYSSLDWCKVLTKAGAPRQVVRAVDAARRRNELVYSVVEEMFFILHLIDLERSVAWESEFLEKHRGDLDPDLVRDLLRAWRRVPGLPAEALEWAFAWSADRNLGRQWPAVVREADLLLRRHALQAWKQREGRRNANLEHLRRLLEQHNQSDTVLVRWLESTVTDIGASVHFFVESSRSVLRAEAEPEDAEWRRAALLQELRNVQALFPPVLILADILLAVPDGAYRFALAFFGLTGDSRRQWERRVEEYARDVLRKAFLDDLRAGIPAIETIRRFCFGDRDLFLRMTAHLDFITKEFDSLRERDKVIRELAVYYASYRQPELLAAEVARRYRDLMRVLHEDNLRRVLTPEQFEEVSRFDVLKDLASLAADARRYLSRRRALDLPLEHMVAAELDFADSVRARRLFLIRKLLA